MKFAALAALLLSASFSAAQTGRMTVFEWQQASAKFAAILDIDELFARLRSSTSSDEQLELLKEIGLRAKGLRPAEQPKASQGLRDVYLTPTYADRVRGRALDVLGQTVPWMSEPAAVRQSIETLTEAVHPKPGEDSQGVIRLYALRGLSQAAGHLPSLPDPRVEELIVLAALDALRDNLTAQENTLAMLTLKEYLVERGPRLIFQNFELARRADEQVIRPVEGSSNLAALYRDERYSTDYRFFLIHALFRLAAGGYHEWNMPARVRMILQDMGQQDPDGRLRTIARLYAERIRP